MNWKWIFEKGMFWIFILTFLTVSFFSGLETRGINKTVGWTSDQSNQWILNVFFIFCSWMVFVIGYGVITLMRKKTDLNLSIIHLAIFILTLVIGIANDFFGIEILVTTLISTIIFGLNLYRTFKNKTWKTIAE